MCQMKSTPVLVIPPFRWKDLKWLGSHTGGKELSRRCRPSNIPTIEEKKEEEEETNNYNKKKNLQKRKNTESLEMYWEPGPVKITGQVFCSCFPEPLQCPPHIVFPVSISSSLTFCPRISPTCGTSHNCCSASPHGRTHCCCLFLPY